jgi:hypothetical protein
MQELITLSSAKKERTRLQENKGRKVQMKSYMPVIV